MIDDTLPPQLVAAVRNRNLLVVAGAGISMMPPSSLPSWWDFNVTLLEGIRARAAELLPDQEELLRGLNLTGRVPISAFSDLVVRTFAGDGYFPLLTALEGARPNANHCALATLAADGIVAEFVTFNFDTLIEQAFREAGVPLEVLVRPDDYDRLDLEPTFRPRLHKVHGSVTDAVTLVDTVTQKLQGLSFQRRILLAAMFRERHVLFVGFSGADFDFGSDYLPMGANREGGFGFTWLYRGTPPALAERFADTDGVFLAGTLPGFFERLAVVLKPVSKLVGPATDIRARVDAWTAKPEVGPWACAALCQRLASELGKEEIGQGLNDALAERLASDLQANRFSITMTGVIRQLALAALSAGDTQRALVWSVQELHIYEAIASMAKAAHRELSPQAQLEYLRNTAGAFSNIGLAHAHGKQPGGREAARTAFLEAQARLRDAQDKDTEALLLLNMAEHLETEPDAKLRALRRARAAAQTAGAGRTLIEVACAEAELLIELSEIDVAIEVAALATPLLLISGNAQHVWRHTLARTEAAVRRGNWEAGLAACEATLSAGQPGPALARQVAGRLRKLLAFNAASLHRLKALLEALGQAGDVSVSSLGLVVAETSNEQETTLRETIAIAEMQGRLSDLVGLFTRLCKLKHDGGDANRLVDVAKALRHAALRAHSSQGLVVAEQYLGIGYDLLGDLRLAAAAFRAAIATAPVAGWRVGHFQANLGDIVWRQGDISAAEQLFKDGRADLEAATEWDQLAIATVKYGRCLDGAGRSTEATALIHETADLMDVKHRPELANGLRSTAIVWANKIDLPSEKASPDRPQDLQDLPPLAISPQALGNLAIREIERGETEAARAHLEAALQLYRQAKDASGESRCLSNLAQLHASLNEWSQAVNVARQALALREAVDDLEGQILIMSNLAGMLLKSGDAEGSVAMARACLRLDPTGKHALPFAAARVALAQALAGLHRWGDARVAVSAAFEALFATDYRERATVAKQLEDVATGLAAAEQAAQRHVDISAATMRVITAAKDHKAPNIRAETLRQALSSTNLNHVDRATLFGEYGNALADAGSFRDAQIAYGKARRKYEAAGHWGMAWHTRVIMASVLERSGDVDTAESAMLDILRDCPVAKVRANLLIGYANLVFHHRVDDAKAVDNVRTRLRDVAKAGGIDAETLGRAKLYLAQCEWILDDRDAARAMVREAKELLVRSNSSSLSDVAKLEAAYKKAGDVD